MTQAAAKPNPPPMETSPLPASTPTPDGSGSPPAPRGSAARVEAYTPAHAAEWNAFVAGARNATFLFERGYMDYHADRFTDCSALCYDEENRLAAVLPANRAGDVVYSHQGLTYGGLVRDVRVTTAQTMQYFNLLNAHYRALGANAVVYKPIPAMYCAYPSEEDLYCLFRLGATLTGRAIASVVLLANRYRFSGGRKDGVRLARKAKLTVTTPTDFGPYWRLLAEHLREKYGTAPVHSLAEMQLLHERFPDRIRLYQANQDDEPLAGVVLYLTERVAHVQYITSTDEGRRIGALDLIFDQLLNREFAAPARLPYFDFGTSTEQNGHYLNAGLVFQKEGFGGRGVVYDRYEYALSDATPTLSIG